MGRNGTTISTFVEGISKVINEGEEVETGDVDGLQGTLDVWGGDYHTITSGGVHKYSGVGKVGEPRLILDFSAYPDDCGTLETGKWLSVELDEDKLTALIYKCLDVLTKTRESRSTKDGACFTIDHRLEEEAKAERDALRKELCELKYKGRVHVVKASFNSYLRSFGGCRECGKDFVYEETHCELDRGSVSTDPGPESGCYCFGCIDKKVDSTPKPEPTHETTTTTEGGFTMTSRGKKIVNKKKAAATKKAAAKKKKRG
jgi:hypothetical protein